MTETLTTKKNTMETCHDWVGPTRHNVYVHCARCGKIFEIGKAKGTCTGAAK